MGTIRIDEDRACTYITYPQCHFRQDPGSSQSILRSQLGSYISP